MSRDTARLNFLLANDAYVVADGEPGYHDYIVVASSNGRPLGRGDTQRDAIDNAILKCRY